MLFLIMHPLPELADPSKISIGIANYLKAEGDMSATVSLNMVIGASNDL